MLATDRFRSGPLFHVKRWAVIALLGGAVLQGSGCASTSRDLVSGNKRGFGYTWAQQVQLGRESDPQITAQFGRYTDEELSAYVNGVGQRLLAQSHLRRAGVPAEVQNTPFTFRVLDSPVVNAFALPGGFIYVTRGLLAHLDNEAQLAVVLGHEIGHVARQHSARQAFEAQRGQLGLLAGAVLGQAVLGGGAAQNIMNIGGQAFQLLQLKYSRGDEREADALGVEYATLTGYKADEGAAFFTSLKRIQQQSGESLPNFLASHPDPGEREGTIRQLAAEWDARTTQVSTTVRENEFKAEIDGVVFGENPRQGFVEGDAFYHPDLKFQFSVPQGFQVQNDAQQVLIGEARGQAIMQLRIAQGGSAASAAQAFAGQEGVRVLDSGQETVNGLRASFVAADAQGGQGALRLLNYFVEHEGAVYSLLGVAQPNAFATYQEVFVRTFRSFRPLTDRRVLAIQPPRLDIVPAARTATFQALVPSSLPRGVTAADLAIVNQLSLGTTVQAGTRLKVVRQ